MARPGEDIETHGYGVKDLKNMVAEAKLVLRPAELTRFQERLVFIRCRMSGMSVSDASNSMGISVKGGYNIQAMWNLYGPKGIYPNFAGGRKPKMSRQQFDLFCEAYRNAQMSAKDAREYIWSEFGIHYSLKQVYVLISKTQPDEDAGPVSDELALEEKAPRPAREVCWERPSSALAVAVKARGLAAPPADTGSDEDDETIFDASEDEQATGLTGVHMDATEISVGSVVGDIDFEEEEFADQCDGPRPAAQDESDEVADPPGEDQTVRPYEDSKGEQAVEPVISSPSGPEDESVCAASGPEAASCNGYDDAIQNQAFGDALEMSEAEASGMTAIAGHDAIEAESFLDEPEYEDDAVCRDDLESYDDLFVGQPRSGFDMTLQKIRGMLSDAMQSVHRLIANKIH